MFELSIRFNLNQPHFWAQTIRIISSWNSGFHVKPFIKSLYLFSPENTYDSVFQSLEVI